jgi:hypothetical protein
VQHRGRGRTLRRSAPALVYFCLLALAWSAALAQDMSPAKPRIVVYGDSQAQGIAGGMNRVLLESPRFKILNRTHPGASLVHGEEEWLGPIRKFAATEKADIAVVMFGANDRLDITNAESAKYLHFKSEAWRAEYVRRADMIMAQLADTGMKVIWCGNPIARSDVYSSDMSYINQIFAERAAHFGFQFLPLWEMTADESGKYTAFGKDLDGVTKRLRADDGIHFTSVGYQLVAEKIIDLIPANAADGK